MGLVALWHVGSSQTRDWTHVPCTIRPGLPIHHQLLELAQTQVHQVSDAIQPLSLCHPLLLLPSIFPSIRDFSRESILFIWLPKYWSFSFNISPSNEYSRLISFNGLVGSPCSPRDSQESSPTLQFKSIKSLALNFLYGCAHTYKWLLAKT